MLESFTFSNGVTVVNTTPQAITFQDGDEVVSVPASGLLIETRRFTMVVRKGTPTLLRSEFDTYASDIIPKIMKEVPGAVIVGNVDAAQAFPGQVFCPIPMFDYEEVTMLNKDFIMNPGAFTTY